MAANKKTTIALFGATGNTGKAVLAHALELGYAVRAMVRTPTKVTTKNESLKVIQGELDDLSAIKDTVQGCDYVVSVVGGPQGNPGAYPASLMETFVKLLVPVLKESKTIKAFSYQAGFLAATPAEVTDNTLPWSIYLFRYIVTRSIEPNLMDHQTVLQYLESEGKSDSYSTTVIMASVLKEGDATRTLVSQNERCGLLKSVGGVTFEEIAKLNLANVKEISVKGISYIWPSPP